MANLGGFWSYVRADDETDGGRISRLARDIVEQYKMLTGEEISLFLDKDSIEWGENWRKELDSNLTLTAFFIPVLTPRYFMSPECRRELQSFARKATKLGFKELILPLLYVDIPALNAKEPTDDLVTLVSTFQWEDWRDLRFSDVTSEAYRRGIARLATRLVEANKQADQTPIEMPAQADETTGENMDNSPGTIDLLATAEEKLTKLPETLQAITKEMEIFTQIAQETTADIQRGDSQGKGFAARLIAAQRMAARPSEPAQRVQALTNEYASQLHDVDEGFRIIIDHAPAEIRDHPETKANFCAFFKVVRNLVSSSNAASNNIQVFINSLEPLEKMSRDLRPVLRLLKQEFTILVESRAVSNEWGHLIDASGVLCEETDSQT